MTDTVIRLRLLVLILLCLASIGVLLVNVFKSSPAPQLFAVHFLDVGQGDAILVTTPTGESMLIDGGQDGRISSLLSQTLGWFTRDIDLVVRTHPDLDHVGGLVDVLRRYQVATILTTENTGETTAAAAFNADLEAEGAEIVLARAGQKITLGPSTTIAVLSPARNPALLESNASSIVLQIRYGEIEFMLTGDAPQGIEDYLVTEYGTELESEVLKLGHHGSDTSSSALFLETVKPDFAVVSAAPHNRYGHPHPAVVERSAIAGAEVLTTAEVGTITFVTDGVTLWRQ